MTSGIRRLTDATAALAAKCANMKFARPAAHVYHPLIYAREPHLLYLQKFAAAPKRVLFVGMNPGPWGMAQTGVPFGEIAAVRDWMNIRATVSPPPYAHPARPVLGFNCKRSEISGRRLWNMFAAEYPRAKDFFAGHFVANYCPLLFLDENAKNITPDKLRADDRQALFAACDILLQTAADILRPQFCIGVGAFAEAQIRRLFRATNIRTGKILHPSPASPAANKNFADDARRQLAQIGAWNPRANALQSQA